MSYITSDEREMLAILMAIKAFGKLLKGLFFQVLTDNISAIAFVNHMGGPSPPLSQLARAIWSEATEHGMSLRCAHIAGKINTVADAWSRTPDKHNWMIHQRLLNYIDKRYGPHTVDRFANCQNAQLTRYNSRYWDPLSEGVDALAQKDWAQENNFVNAPFCLIPQVLDIVQCQKAHATIAAIEVPNVVQSSNEDVGFTSVTHPEQLRSVPIDGTDTRAMPEPEVADLCLESLWWDGLKGRGWSETSANRLQFCLARSTIASYNKVILRYEGFCKSQNCAFPPESTAILADFLCETAASSSRPNSVLRTALAA